MPLDPDFQQKIKKKNIAEIESAWNARMESAPRELDWFFAVAEEMHAAKLQPKLIELLLSLSDALGVEDAWEEAFDALGKAIELAPRNREVKTKVAEVVRARFPDRKDVEEVLKTFDVEEAEDPVRAFGALHDWLRFKKGAGYWLFGRGLGKVSEVNLGLQKVKINFEKAAPLVMRADEAKRLLTYLPDDHFMMRRLEDAEGLAKEAKADPGAFIRELFLRFRRPMTSSEIKECMVGVIDGGRWASWWTKAKAHPQVLPSAHKRNSFEWSDSAESAEEKLMAEFRSASLPDRLELARKHFKRGGAVREGMLDGLQGELARVAEKAGSEAVEVTCLIEELGGELPAESPLDLDAILKSDAAADVISGVSDRRYRDRLYRKLKKVRGEDWPEFYRQAFLAETDLRLMTQLYDVLLESGPERAAERLVAESVAQPRRTPRPFVWVTRNVLLREELSRRANHALLSKIMDALDSDEFKELKAPLREQFEEGGLAFAVFDRSDREGVDHLLNLIDSASALEEHRKTEIRRAIFRKYPDIRKRTDDGVFATAEAIESKRAEFEQLVKTEIPENAEAIRVAREYGDLRENFEYHAARQKHEVLNARAARLHEDLNKVRVIDANVETATKVAIGTSFELQPVGGGPARPVTILGPWDSDPDQGVYSYLSEFANGLLASGEGDVVSLEDGDFRVANLRPWRTGEAVRSSDS